MKIRLIMTMYEHILHGCAPVPLGSYLKALGIFRLVAEQADKDATKGFWRDERFVLKTKLSEEELIAFFVEKYEPSPIISPWNGRAGFLEGEEDGEEESTRKGAELVRAYQSAADRFGKLRGAVQLYQNLPNITQLDRTRTSAKALQEKKRKKIALSEQEKESLRKLESETKKLKGAVIAALRDGASYEALPWFDACIQIASTNVVAPLLGAGGADGSRDFGMSYGEALAELFEFTNGNATPACEALFRATALQRPASSLSSGNVGMFAPGAEGENQGVGFKTTWPLNPWDIVLLLEGVFFFAGASSRRLTKLAEKGGSFPFSVDALTAGSGAASFSDDKGFSEFWAPIWLRPATMAETFAVFREGRTVLGRTAVNDGLKFAVAVKALGAQRGIVQFHRYAILQREPRNPRKATSLGRVDVAANPVAELQIELDRRNWLRSIQTAAGDKGVSASFTLAVRKLDDALFRLAADGSPEAVQGALIAIGRIALECARRPKLRTEDDRGRFPTTPPPRLSAEWRTTANDGSAEFALAAALAGIDAKTEKDAEGKRFYLPFRAHLAPIKAGAKSDEWSDTTESRALAVWTGRDLVRDLAAIAERRLIEPQRRTFLRANKVGADTEELPLGGFPSAPLWAIGKFLVQETDDQRIADLAAGLAWVQGGALETRKNSERTDPLPFAYAALKPLFNPGGVGSDHRRIDPLPIVRLLTAGRTSDAIALAQRMARGAGLAVPFARMAAGASVDPMRLAAALLFPLSRPDTTEVADRAYPNPTDARQVEEPAHAH